MNSTELVMYTAWPFCQWVMATTVRQKPGAICYLTHPVQLMKVLYCLTKKRNPVASSSRTLIINYRWPAAIGLVPLWQAAKYV